MSIEEIFSWQCLQFEKKYSQFKNLLKIFKMHFHFSLFDKSMQQLIVILQCIDLFDSK